VVNGTPEKMKSLVNNADHSYKKAEGWGAWKKKDETPEYRRFYNRVKTLTRRTYEANKHLINPLDLPRTLAGVEGGYHLDHKVSVRRAFDEGWEPEKVALLENLQMLPWRDNIVKGSK
jgi:hypothetical protein